MSISASGRKFPYQGLLPYEEADAPFFFGRERQTRLIAANLFAAPLTVLYGSTGVGKSSVLRAGVVNHLRSRPDAVVALVQDWQGDAVQSVLSAVSVAETALAGTTPSVPASAPLADFLTGCARRLKRRLVVILDQFEDYLLYPREDQPFVGEFARAVMEAGPYLGFLVAVREESLAALDRFEGRLPGLFDNLLRIDDLDYHGGRAAIEGPVARYNSLCVPEGEGVSLDPELTDIILQGLSSSAEREPGRAASPQSGAISGTLLQLVMTGLWDEEKRVGSLRLRVDTFRRLGGVEGIVRAHVERTIGALTRREQVAAARLFHHLVTPSGVAVAHTVPDLAKYAQVTSKRLVPMLEKLSGREARILKPVAPPTTQPAALRYQISYPVLASPILEWRARHQRHRSRRAVAVTICATTLVLSALGGAGFIVYLMISAAREEAQTHQGLAGSRELAAAAINNLPVDPELSVILAMHALHRAHTREAMDALREAVQASRVIRTLAADAGPIGAIGLDRGGRSLVSGGEDGTARIWEVESGRQLQRLEDHTAAVVSVAFSADGRLVATGSEDASAKLWDARSGRLIWSISGQNAHKEAVVGVAFSPDGRRLATASRDKTVSVWDISARSRLFVRAGYSLHGVAFSHDGRYLATASDDGTARIWDAQSGEEVRRLERHAGPVLGVAWSRDDKRLATASEDRTARVWNLESGRVVVLTGHTGPVVGVAFSRDGRLVTASRDGTAKVWNLRGGGAPILTLSGHAAVVVAVDFSWDGRRLATASGDTVRVWDATPPREVLTFAEHAGRVHSVDFSPAGNLLVSGSTDSTARIWDATSGRERHTLHHAGAVSAVAFSQDGRWVATASWDRTARVWEVATGKEQRRLVGHTGRVVGVAVSRDGRVATASWDRTARVWDPVSGAFKTFEGHTGAVVGVAFSQNGQRLATASKDGTARVWDSKSGRELVKLPGHASRTLAVAFNPNGTSLVTASDDGIVRMWDMNSWQVVLQFDARKAAVLGIAFSRDGKKLAAASEDGTTRVWDVTTGMEEGVLRSLGFPVYGVAFSPDGRYLATANQDGTARVYIVNVQDLKLLAQTRVTRSLTVEECRTYLRKDPCPPLP